MQLAQPLLFPLVGLLLFQRAMEKKAVEAAQLLNRAFCACSVQVSRWWKMLPYWILLQARPWLDCKYISLLSVCRLRGGSGGGRVA